jgi:hypothetical protein
LHHAFKPFNLSRSPRPSGNPLLACSTASALSWQYLVVDLRLQLFTERVLEKGKGRKNNRGKEEESEEGSGGGRGGGKGRRDGEERDDREGGRKEGEGGEEGWGRCEEKKAEKRE